MKPNELQADKPIQQTEGQERRELEWEMEKADQALQDDLEYWIRLHMEDY